MLGFPTVLRASTLEKVLLPVSHNHITLVSSYMYISLSFQILQYGHCLFPTLWMMLPNWDLEFLGQDGQELLQHQQVQDLLGVCLWSEPLMAELDGAGSGPAGVQGNPGSRSA